MYAFVIISNSLFPLLILLLLITIIIMIIIIVIFVHVLIVQSFSKSHFYLLVYDLSSLKSKGFVIELLEVFPIKAWCMNHVQLQQVRHIFKEMAAPMSC